MSTLASCLFIVCIVAISVLFLYVFNTKGSSVPFADDLPSDSCSGLNKTVYAYPYQKVANVKLPNGVKAKLPIGVSEFQWHFSSVVCTFYVEVFGKSCRWFSDFRT